jgi:uncharacterized protein (TIGR02145 family)
MKKLFILLSISIAFVTNTFAQSEFVPRVTEKGHSINQYDTDGKKHGYWEAYINENLGLVKKKGEAAFMVIVCYDHGKPLWDYFFFDHSKKLVLITERPKFEKGNPKYINGFLSFKFKKVEEYKDYYFEDGMLIKQITHFRSNYGRRDIYNDNKIHDFEIVSDFSNSINGLIGSYNYYEMADSAILYKMWYRKEDNKWKYYYSCGFCSAFDDSSFTIGEDTWANKNLLSKTFRNGDTILYANTKELLDYCFQNEIPAWTNKLDSKGNVIENDVVYNWYAVNDSRGLAPKGWRIANDDDYQNLKYTLGVYHVDFLKSNGRHIEKELLGSNYSGFNGTREGCSGPWWSSTDEEDDTGNSWTLGTDKFEIEYLDRSSYFSVRCIKE